MGAFGGLIITNKGIALQAKVQAGAELHFSRIGVGDGTLGGQSIPTLTNLISEKMSLDITKLKVLGGGKAVVGGVLSNQGVTTGFYFREIGVFAMDPDEGEILYCYGNAGSGAEYIPPGGGPDVIEKQIDIVTIIGNASNVSAEIPSAVYATVDQLEAHINATTGVHGATSAATPNRIVQRDSAGRFKAAAPAASDDVARKAEIDTLQSSVNNVSSSLDAHASNTSNPHGVTKAQVGLGNVQNYGIATQAQAEAGTANNVYMTPLRTKNYVDTRLLNNLQFRMNAGVVEYNDGGGWKPVGFDPRTMELNSFNHFADQIIVGAKSYSDILTVNGKGVLSEFAIYVYAPNNEGKLGVSLVTDGNEVPLYIYDNVVGLAVTPVVTGLERFGQTNSVQARIVEFNSLAAYESSLIIRLRNESELSVGSVRVILRGVYYT
jgi:hypothetical protein